jgi:ribosomal protein S14
METFWLARAGKHRAHQATAFRLQRVWLRAIARSIGSTRSACEFVLDSTATVVRVPRGWFGKTPPLDAKAICAGMAELCRINFRDAVEAREILTHWGIRRSEDVAVILRALVDAGMARAEGVKDFDRDFAGLFVTERWLSQ